MFPSDSLFESRYFCMSGSWSAFILQGWEFENGGNSWDPVGKRIRFDFNVDCLSFDRNASENGSNAFLNVCELVYIFRFGFAR